MDSINLATGALSIRIPVVSFPQRGAMHLDYALTYSGSGVGLSGPRFSTGTEWYAGPGGIGILNDGFPTVASSVSTCTSYTGCEDFTASLYDANGNHPLGFINSTATQARSVDGTGYFVTSPLQSSSYTITDRHGVTTSQNAGLLLSTDTNGNQMSKPYPGGGAVTDTTGKVIPGPGYLSGNGSYTWSTPAPNGSTANYKSTNSGAILPNGSSTNFAFALPSGRSYSFVFQAVTLPLVGDEGPDSQQSMSVVNEITLPSGGTISYTYATEAVFSFCSGVYASAPVLSRTVNANDGTGAHKWTYSYSGSSTTVTDPLGNTSIHTFKDSCTPYEIQLQEKDKSGHLLKTVTTAYENDTVSVGGTEMPLNNNPTSITTIWPNGTQSAVNLTYDRDHNTSFLFGLLYETTTTNTGPQGTIFMPGVSGYTSDPWTQAQTDLGQGANGAVLRNATTSYKAFSAASYLASNLLDLPSSVQVTNGGGTLLSQTTYGYDEYSLASSGVSGLAAVNGSRGNPTSVTHMVSSSSSIATHAHYDNAGQVVSSTDGNGHVTSYGHDTTDTYLTKTTYPSVTAGTFSTSYTPDSNTGVILASTDMNGHTTNYGYDDMSRPTTSSYPDGGSTTIGYGGNAIPQVISTSTVATPNPTEASSMTLDGLGRVGTEVLTSGASVVTVYDALGRVSTTTNPYSSTSDPTYGVIQYTYDGLGRVVVQTQQDGSTQQWCFNGTATNGQTNCQTNKSSLIGNWVDFTDESGNHWQRVSDGLGRLTAVMEPNPTTNATTIETDYTYDALNNLTRVDQWGGAKGAAGERVRTFSYDGLSRLLTATNPESGTTCYGVISGSSCVNGYDSDGNLVARTDARGVVTNYAYDALNRITSVTYPTIPAGVAPTPALSYSYDSAVAGWTWHPQTSPSWPSVTQTNLVGRLTGVVASGTGTLKTWIVYGYDSMGRTLLKAECLPSDCGDGHYDQHYKYDVAGNLIFYDRGLDSIRNEDSPNDGFYFGGYTQAFDGAGRVISVTGDTTGTNVASNILSNTTYFPTGQQKSALKLGVYDIARTYTPRGFYTGQTITNTAGQAIWNSSANYSKNGAISGTTDRYAGSWTYTYDHLDRVFTAVGPGGSTTYSTDLFGNKYEQTTTAGSAPAPDYGTASTNALTGNGLTYDLTGTSGNVTYDGTHAYTYDAEGRLYSVNGSTCYTYDGESNRVATSNCSGNVSGITAEFLYDPSHRLMTQVSMTSYTKTRANIYAGAEYLGEDAPDAYETNTPAASLLRITDQVGSLRARWDLGSNWDGACTSFPYGDGMSCAINPQSTALYTGKDRDSESNLDYFGARYYSSQMGRFLSPDPSGLAYANLFNPQSFNLYGYVQNNPLTNTDPTGLDCVHINNDTGAYEGFESGDCDNSTEALANSGHYVDGTLNQISFNSQNQVIGYSGSTGDGQFDSFAGSLSAGGAAFSLNPYSLTGTAPGQSVSVTANPSAGPDISIASVFSLIAAGKIKPTSGPQVSAVPKLTTGQIYNLCALAVSLGAGGNVPGGSPRGTASLSPSEDTPPIHMPVPGKNGLAFVPMNEDAAKVENPLAGLALVGSLGDCVNAVSKAN